MRLDRVADTLARLPSIGAAAYCGVGSRRADPIVDKHFTPGNQGRNGWEPLSRDYFLAKGRQKGALRKGMKAAGRKQSKLDDNAGFQSSTGELVGIGAGTNLPMLVRKGELREAVASKQHRIDQAGDVAWITFTNLPEQAKWHHEGTATMPKRSPVEPSAADVEEVVAEMEKAMSLAAGTGGEVPVEGGFVPNRARVI